MRCPTPLILLVTVAPLLATPRLAAAPIHPTISSKGPSTLADVAFMTGDWRGAFQGSILEESFSPPRAGTMMGMFRWIADDATSLTEHLVLEAREDGVHLFLRHFNAGLTPWAQEAEGAMHYRLVSHSEGKAVFEDPNRDFPRQIIYERTAPDTLVSRLEGATDADRHMEFVYRSVNMPTTAQDALTKQGHKLGYSGGLTLAISVKDLSKSIEFYENILGFKMQYRMDEMGWCELTTGVPGVNVGLSQVENPKQGGPTPTFGVNDVDKARAELEGKGVKFDGETQVIPDMVKLATFYDPDGNSLMLYQSLSPMVP